VLVGCDTGSLKGLGGDLLLLQGEKVDAGREGVDGQPLLSDIKDLDLRLGYTTAIPRLNVGLVLDVTGALPRTCTTEVTEPSTHTTESLPLTQPVLLTRYYQHVICRGNNSEANAQLKKFSV